MGDMVVVMVVVVSVVVVSVVVESLSPRNSGTDELLPSSFPGWVMEWECSWREGRREGG